MRKLLMASAAATAIAAAQLPAQDAAADGLYLSGFGGVGWAKDLSGDYFYNGPKYGFDIEANTGYVLGVAGGYKFDFGARVELEFGYRSNDIGTISFSTGNSAFDGNINVYTLMTNGWYDFDLGSGFSPYLGGGIGIAWLQSDDWQYAQNYVHSDDTDTAFAYQLGAGVNYAFNETVSVGLGYRFLGTTSYSLNNKFPNASSYDMDPYHNHSVLLNLTVSFGGVD